MYHTVRGSYRERLYVGHGVIEVCGNNMLAQGHVIVQSLA